MYWNFISLHIVCQTMFNARRDLPQRRDQKQLDRHCIYAGDGCTDLGCGGDDCGNGKLGCGRRTDCWGKHCSSRSRRAFDCWNNYCCRSGFGLCHHQRHALRWPLVQPPAKLAGPDGHDTRASEHGRKRWLILQQRPLHRSLCRSISAAHPIGQSRYTAVEQQLPDDPPAH